jgi:hypothetical protein
VACLRNAMLSKLLDAEEKLRAATAEHEATSRCACAGLDPTASGKLAMTSLKLHTMHTGGTAYKGAAIAAWQLR